MRVRYPGLFSICVKAGIPTLLIAGGLMTAHTQKAAANENTGAVVQTSGGQNSQGTPTVEEARKFTEAAEIRLLDLMIKSGRAQWVQETFITHDTEQIAADADQQGKGAVSEL